MEGSGRAKCWGTAAVERFHVKPLWLVDAPAYAYDETLYLARHTTVIEQNRVSSYSPPAYLAQPCSRFTKTRPIAVQREMPHALRLVMAR